MEDPGKGDDQKRSLVPAVPPPAARPRRSCHGPLRRPSWLSPAQQLADLLGAAGIPRPAVVRALGWRGQAAQRWCYWTGELPDRLAWQALAWLERVGQAGAVSGEAV